MSTELEEAHIQIIGCLVLVVLGVVGGFTALVALALIKYVWGF